MAERKFVNVQAVATGDTVTLFATANDETVWSISGGVGNNWTPYSGSIWKKIPSLPEREATPIPPMKL